MTKAALVAFVGVAIAAVGLPAGLHGSPLVVYNPSDSAPRGWYRITPARSLRVGGFVLARLPSEAAALAAQRGYLPRGVPILKRIGAVSGQEVCVRARRVRIDGVVIAALLVADGRGRSLPTWDECRQLVDGELFLLGVANPASFDSRYFGPIAARDVIGAAQPVWTWSTP